jgi:tetratricopeptide (TPR) repeat protein
MSRFGRALRTIGATVDFLRKVKSVGTIERLRERARHDGTPRGYVDLCHALVVQGKPLRALSVAQEGVRCFPRSLELADQLRLIWGQAARGELHELAQKARESKSAEAFRALADHYLSVEELDLALESAQQLFAAHPTLADGPWLVGRTLWKRFVRDHVASDGLRAIEALRRAVSVDPKSFEALNLLAEACFYIGAVGKALEAAAQALALKPADRDVATLHAMLLQLTHQEPPEGQLLRDVEETDSPWRGYRAPQARNQPFEPSAKARIARMLHQISLMAGVRSLAFARPDLELVARDGNVFEGDRSKTDAMATLTAMFRERIATSTKRLGIGARVRRHERRPARRDRRDRAHGDGPPRMPRRDGEPRSRSRRVVRCLMCWTS